MRNEGPFIVEWVSWYRMLGFEVLVVTNDCTDHSVALLQALERQGWLAHRPHRPRRRQHPKHSAYAAMRAHPLVAQVDWVLVCDVDEFLVLHRADRIDAFLNGFSQPPLGVCFHWRVFGTGGQTTWQDGLVHRNFHQAAPRETPANTSFKTLFRRPTAFAAFCDHAPMNYAGPWAVDGQVFVDCNGKRLQRLVPDNRPQKATAPDRVRHGAAQLNHYMLRSKESFALKRGTPSASTGRDRYNAAFLQTYDRNEVRDEGALRFAARFDAVHAEAMALPEVFRLHHKCCGDYVVRLANKQGIRPVDDPRWQHHMAQIAELEGCETP